MRKKINPRLVDQVLFLKLSNQVLSKYKRRTMLTPFNGKGSSDNDIPESDKCIVYKKFSLDTTHNPYYIIIK